MAGLAAAQEAIKQGFSVRVIEARDRLGGRVITEPLGGDLKVDMGASWIHGIGPGCGEDDEWKGKMNPIYTIAQERNIKTVKTWNDEEETTASYYWWKEQEEPLDQDWALDIGSKVTEFIQK